MNQFEQSAMSVEEAREVAELYIQASDTINHVSVSHLAQTLHAQPHEIEALLEQVRGRTAFEQARGREHRNVWIAGLAALCVGVVFMGLFLAVRFNPDPGPVTNAAPVIWEAPTAEAPMAPMPDSSISAPDALAPSPTTR